MRTVLNGKAAAHDEIVVIDFKHFLGFFGTRPHLHFRDSAGMVSNEPISISRRARAIRKKLVMLFEKRVLLCCGSREGMSL